MSSHLFEITCSVALSFLKTISCLEVISKEIFSNLDNLTDSCLNIFGGDFNTHLDPLKDKFPITYKIKTQYAQNLLDLMEELKLVDIWR